MAGFKQSFDKFLLLMWKNWRLQLRHPIQTVLEIIVPVFFCAILVVVRSLAHSEVIDITGFLKFDPADLSYPHPNFTMYTLAYSPNNELLEEIMRAAAKKMGHAGKLEGYDSAQKLENALIAEVNAGKVGVVFPDDFAGLTNKMEFEFRFPSELQSSQNKIGVDTWRTNLLFALFQTPGPRDRYRWPTASPDYAQEGFLLLQSLVSQEIVQRQAVAHKQFEFKLPTIQMQRFPYPSYINDVLLEIMKNMISLIILLAFLYTSISIIKVITTEKEKQLKEAMKIMGLPGWLHWTAWFTKSFLFMLISVTLMVALLKIEAWYEDDVPAVLPNCNFVLLFIFLVLFITATITLCFAISVFFTQANMAAGIGGVLFFLFMVPYTIMNMNYQDLTLSTKLSASLMSNTAMAYGFQLICMFESTGEGLQWNNLFSPVTPDDNITMAHIFLMLIIDSIIYMCVALYVEAIYPGKYGVAKPWHFVFTWPFKTKTTPYNGDVSEDVNSDHSKYEEEPKDLNAGIHIRGLTKIYGDKTAVNQMHLKMYEDQITVLLGHNGAGKTTTMSMLTGLETPTAGTAMVNTHDLRTEMDQVRSSLGLCPQHNILFDELTVAEHIYFFSRLKGMNEKAIAQEINDYLQLLQLEDKRNNQSKTLSGGMKRKLSVAVAFCGGSKVIMLDEPTAGMDPSARRALWEMVESQKKGRTIMLTTHFMDEADLLGDRIAIMAAGELQCCGSSFFLKKRYGAGYRLIIDKLQGCDVEKVTNALVRYIPHIKVDSNIGSELSYLLNEEDSAHFEKMLSNLEENLVNLGIGSYGISLTTLEEVFMKVGADNTLHNLEDSSKPANNGSVQIEVDVPLRTAGMKLIKNQLLAMLLKRALSTLRSWPLLLTQFLIPIIMLILAVVSGRQSNTNELPKLQYSLDAYRNPVTLLTCTHNDAMCKATNDWLQSKSLQTERVKNITDSILAIASMQPATFRSSYIVAADFDADKNNILAWFNNEPYHTPPLVLNFAYNSILKSINPEYELNVAIHPLPLTADSKFKLLQQGNNLGFQMAINIGFCMSFISAFYILCYVRERTCKAKHLQFVSGINVFAFWAVSYLWDWCTYIITIALLLITLICFQEEGFSESESIANLILIFYYFGFCMLPFIYVMSFQYELPSTGFMRVILYAVLFGTFGFIIVEILYFDSLGLVSTAKVLDWLFLLVPHYSLSNGIRNFNWEFQRIAQCEKYVAACLAVPGMTENQCWKLAAHYIPQCESRTTDYYSFLKPGIGRNVLITMAVGCLLVMLVFLLEFKIIDRIAYVLKTKPTEEVNDKLDDDVAAEMAKVRAMGDADISKYNLVMKNINKLYWVGINKPSFHAVKGLCLGVKEYECFGLLGVNGAGKTTTFKMITGDDSISSGDVFVKGLNLKYNLKDVYKLIGYCPQFDALFDDLTGREIIRVFCLLRGYENSEVDHIAESLAKRFDYIQHLDKKVREMSGGNKRKLSTSVALIGDPPIIYLDEPTTGMDPATKRHLWNALCKLRDEGKCLILTTHSMEECEALCTRLAIMVNGQFKCLGSTQHLKNKFARGFSLTIKLKKQNDYTEAMKRLTAFVASSLPSAVVHEQHQEMITFAIPNSGLPWSKMFGIMEGSKTQLDIEDYSLGQSSLEQVFLRFTQEQAEQVERIGPN